jgi:hypothetical protein
LAGQNDDRDGGGETDRHRIGDILDVGPPAHGADDHHDDAGHHRDKNQAVIAMPLDDRVNQDDECAGRAADLKPAAAKGGYQKAADDRRVQPAIGA